MKRIRYGAFLILAFVGMFLSAGCTTENKGDQNKETANTSGFEKNYAVVEEIANNREKEADWRTVYQAAVALRELRDKRTEKVFLKILDRKDAVRLKKGSELPQVMAPLNMLKSIAVESLHDTGGREYLEAFKRVSRETDEPLLQKMILKHIKTLEGKKSE